MKNLSKAALLLLGSLPAAGIAQTTTLSSLKHKARPVLIFGSANDPHVAEQLQDLTANADALRERDIRVVQIPVATVSSSRATQLKVFVFSTAEQQHARKKFNVASDTFTVVLVGKDGGEKLRSDVPIPWQTIEATIDGMPMRKNEAKRR